jgi:molybdopterin molybdotransferase
VLSIGGISVGERDLVKAALQSLGGVLELSHVKMKPGKPISHIQLNGRPVLCLPGNPGAVFLTFSLMVSPLIRRMQGRFVIFPRITNALFRTSRSWADGRDNFVRVRHSERHDGVPGVEALETQAASGVHTLYAACGFVRIKANTFVNDGDSLPFYDLNDWLR